MLIYCTASAFAEILNLKKGHGEWKREAATQFSRGPFVGMLRDMLAAQWGLLWGVPLPDPDETPPLEDILKGTPPDSFMLPQEYKVDPAAEKGMEALMLHRPENHANLSVFAGLLVLNYYPENDPELTSGGIINLRLSKKTIMKSFESYLDEWLRERKGAQLQQRKPSRRVRLEEGIKQLKVFDLRMSGETFSQIGTTAFQDEEGNLEKKAKDHFKMAKRLIENPPLLLA